MAARNHNSPPVRVSIAGPTSAFGEVMVGEPTPYARLKFTEGLVPDLVVQETSGSGTIAAASSLVTVASGTTAGSVARLRSRDINAEYSTDATGFSGGTPIQQVVVEGNAGTIVGIPGQPSQEGFYPGEMLVITGEVGAGGASSNGYIAMTFYEAV